MKQKTEQEKRAFLIREGASLTIEQLISILEITRAQLYQLCIRNGIQPRDSVWCSRPNKGDLPNKRVAIERVKGEYSNSTPYGIAKH